MASSSSSSSSSSTNLIPQKKYGVFLSFRGEDTRNNFTSHLHAALCRKGVETFIDDNLVRGDEISESLIDAIEGSTISIIIFSEGYASSRWCLDELVKIVECKNRYGQIVIPVFYQVDPSDVRNQSGKFGDSFSKIEERFKEREEKSENWRIALREAASLSGFDSHVIRPEFELVEKIADDILKRMNQKFSTENNDQLIGVETRILEIESLLNVGSKDVYKLGIWGIGGIGKTAIATAIFNKISSYFEGSCFIQNVREESEKIGGLEHLQWRLLSRLLRDENVKIYNIEFNFRRLRRKKVLIVFDDVSCFGQIEYLIGSSHFGIGSRIIITTRDRQVLQNCRVDEIYKVNELVHDNALKLFSQHAFGQNNANVGYEELSNQVIQYVQGVPLALKILGSFLFARSKEHWASAINKLKRIPNMDIQKVLKISYDGLDDEEKNIFLDIACFLKGEDEVHVKGVLDANGFSAEIGIAVLVDKSLVVKSNNMITMHDLLQEMGREIVRQESIYDPGKRSRLWYPKDIYEVLKNNTGSEIIQAISLDMSKVNEISLNFRTFKKMYNLRFFRLYGENKCKICHFGVAGSIFTKLRYLHWQGYSLKSLPSNMGTENLVLLKLPNSKVEQLWNGVQNLVNLKQINLIGSNQLRKLPDLSLAKNIESLIFEDCSNLVETHSSIQYLNKLIVLNLRECKSLRSLPTSIHFESLKFLGLSGCSNLKRFPDISSCNLEYLDLDGSGIEELPSSIEFLSTLVTLSLCNCPRLKSLPSSLCKLKSLQNLSLSECSNLLRLPTELGNLEALRQLYVKRTALIEIPSSIVCLKNLEKLYLERYKGHEQIGFLLPILLSSDGLQSLTSLKLIDCGIMELPESLGQLSSLEELYLDRNNFKRIPESIINLSKLELLHLNYCQRLQSLPKLPCCLTHVKANHCALLEGLSGLSILFTIRIPSNNFRSINLKNCFKLDQNEVREIIEDGLQKIQLITTAWDSHQKYDLDASGTIHFPGSEIPKLFKYQSMGSSINLELPPSDVNNKLVGFACCIVVAFGDHHAKIDNGLFHVFCEWKYKTNFSCFVKTVGCAESDHIIFGYQLLTSIRGHDFGHNDKGYIHFCVIRSSNGSGVKYGQVKECGIHLFYAKDFGESMKDHKRRLSSDEEGGQHLDPQSSFFK